MITLIKKYQEYNVASAKVSVHNTHDSDVWKMEEESWQRYLLWCFINQYVSKAFDCNAQDFLIFKLEAYGLTNEALNVKKN